MNGLLYNETKFDYLDIDLDLRELLNESMCVATDISELVDKIIETFWMAIPNMRRKKIPQFKNLEGGQIEIPVNITEKLQTTIVGKFLFFKNQPERDRFTIPKPKYNNKENKLYVTVPLVNNWFDSQKTAGSVQHELLHAYNKLSGQAHDAEINWTPERKKGREKNFEKNDRLYNTAVEYIKCTDSTLKAVSIAVYLSKHGEISAFTNGLYKRLYPVFVKKLFSTYDEVLYNDPMYKHYLILKQFCQRLDNNNVHNLENAAQLYNMSDEHVRKLCKQTLQRLERGIAYAVQRAKLDFENDVFRSPSNIE